MSLDFQISINQNNEKYILISDKVQERGNPGINAILFQALYVPNSLSHKLV